MASFETEDFIVNLDKANHVLLERHSKIEKLFNVKIKFEDFSKRDGSQWLAVSGGKSDRRSAKNYILGVCNPEETSTLILKEGIPDPELLEAVERETSAVVDCVGTSELRLAGTALACTLALSKLEDLFSVEILNGADSVEGEDRPDGCEPYNQTSTTVKGNNYSFVRNEPRRRSVATERLDSSLQRAISKASGGECTVDYSTLTPSVKRALLDGLEEDGESPHGICLDNISDELLFASESDFAKSTSPSKQQQQPTVQKSSPLTKQDSPETVPKQTQDQFRQMGLKLGYDVEDVEESLLYFDFSEEIGPCKFLEMLEQVSIEKQGSLSKSDKVASNHQSPCKSTDISRSANMQSGSESLDTSQLVSNTATGLNDSLILLDADDSVCIVDTPSADKKDDGLDFPPWNSQQVQKIQHKLDFPPLNTQPAGRQVSKVPSKSASEVIYSLAAAPEIKSSYTMAVSGSREVELKYPFGGGKRKGHFDDEEQTYVMKPFTNTTFSSKDFDHEASGASSGGQLGTSHQPKTEELRYIVIDGSNVAFNHGKDRTFSCRGIKICVDYFLARGHQNVMVFVPEWRKYRNQLAGPQVLERELLETLKNQGYLTFTPSRRVDGRCIASHDDRYILNLAVMEDAVVVSNDQYREFAAEKSAFKNIIQNRLLPYSFVGNHFMPPDDPLGRNGPTLDQFLKKTNSSPSFQKLWNSTIDPRNQMSPKHRLIHQSHGTQRQHPSQQHQPQPDKHRPAQKKKASSHPKPSPSARPPNVTADLLKALKQLFPEEGQESKIKEVLENHNTETDLNRLTNYCLSALFL